MLGLSFEPANTRDVLESCCHDKDRTEAQARGSLHSHILCWYKPRVLKPHYEALQPVPRTAMGNESKQRPREQIVYPIRDYQEDNIYHSHHVGRIWCEMIRPCVAGKSYGGFNWATLLFAGLARSIQSRFYLHQCTTRYCLLNRSSCRFSFHGRSMENIEPVISASLRRLSRSTSHYIG